MTGTRLAARLGFVSGASARRPAMSKPCRSCYNLVRLGAKRLLSLQLLGGFRAVRNDGRVVHLPERSRALVAYLATSESSVSRAGLASFLSPDEGEQDQRRNLRQALYILRREVGGHVIACSEEGDLVLDEAFVRADVRDFRRAVASDDEQSAIQAIELYRGSFLEGETSLSSDFEDWVRARRSEALDAVVCALTRITHLEFDRGRFDRALEHARKTLELDPLCEEAHRQTIRCLAALGKRSNALLHYEAARQLFREELGVPLEAQTNELHRVLAAGSEDDRSSHASTAFRSTVVRPQGWRGGSAKPALVDRIRAKADLLSIGLAMMGAIVAVLMALVGWLDPRLPAPDAPSLAVLPFDAASGDLAEIATANGIAEELAAMLASYPGLSVLSPGRTKPEAVAGELSVQSGVRYVLSGGVRRSGKVLKITARLTDTRTGFQVWSTQLESDDGKAGELHRRVAEVIDETLIGFAGTIAKEEQRQAWSKSDRGLLEQDFVRRGEQFAVKFTPSDHAKAQEIFNEGLARFPNSVHLRLSLALLYRYAAEVGNGDRDQNLRAACRLGREVARAPKKTRYEDWLSHWLTAKLAQWCDGDFQRSIVAIEAAIALAPYDASTRADMAELLANAGQLARSVEWLQEAIRRDPKPPDWYYRNLAWAYYLDGSLEMALQSLRSRQNPRPDPLLAVVLARSHRDVEARKIVEEYVRQNGISKVRGERYRPLVADLKTRWIRDLASVGLHD